MGEKRVAMFGGSSQSSYHQRTRSACYSDDLYIADLGRNSAVSAVDAVI